jgi:pilus assembly protein CpaF
VREALKQGDTVSVRLPNDYAGQPRPLALRAVPQRDDQGQIRKLMVVVRAEAVLETAQKRSYSVQVDGPDGVVLRAEFSTRGRPYTLGRAKGQDIVLDDPALENVHLSFEVGPAGITVENKSLKDSVAVNQQKLPGGAKLSFADSGDVKVPPYTLKFQRKRVVATMVIKRREGGETMAEVKRNFIQKKVWPEFEARLNLVELERRGVKEVDMRREALKAVKGIVDALPSYPFEGTVDRELLANECAAEFVGLGPMEELLEDADITEIMVLGADTVYVERKGLIERSDRKFLSTSSLRKIIERIVSSKNRRIDESTPYVDTRLDDGSRVHAIIPPLAIDYPVLTIRKFPKHHLSVDDLVRFGSMSPDMANFLELAVKHRQSTVVSGGTGSGKTTILNILSRFIPSNERIITVEDSAELRLQQPHVVRLEARPANIEGKGEVSIRDLVRNCLRMRPDRIIVGECRGREAFDMLQAMNTGHEGSLTTVHANSTRDALGRIESMCLMAAMDLPVPVIRQQIGSAINFVLQQTRLVDGSRKSIMISELTGIEANQLLMQPIFEFKQTGLDKNRKVVGYYTATGMIPKFVERLREIGIPIPLQIFKPTQSAKG